MKKTILNLVRNTATGETRPEVFTLALVEPTKKWLERTRLPAEPDGRIWVIASAVCWRDLSYGDGLDLVDDPHMREPEAVTQPADHPQWEAWNAPLRDGWEIVEDEGEEDDEEATKT